LTWPRPPADHHREARYQVPVDLTLGQVRPENYTLLVLPGGKAPSAIRKETAALEICRHFFAHHKPVAAICHGPQTLISAGLLAGRRAPATRRGRGDAGAGALYEDSEVVVDGNLITSRIPSDLPAFMREIMKKLKG